MLVVPEIGSNWVKRFLFRHPELESRFTPPKDRDQIVAECPKVINCWFELLNAQIFKHKIKKEDIYNMDEKGYAMGLIGKARVITFCEE